MTTISFKEFAKGGEVKPVKDILAQQTAQQPTIPIQSSSPGPLSGLGNIKDAAVAGVKQFGAGFGQTVEGVKQGDFSKVGRGVLNEAAGGISTAFSPISGILKTGADIPLVKSGLDIVDKNVIKPASDENSILTSKPIQDLMMKYPHADEVIGNFVTILTSFLGGEGKTAVEGALNKTIDATSGAVDTLSSGVKNAVEPVTNAVGNTLKSAGEKAYQVTVPMQESTSRAMVNYAAEQPSFFSRLKGMLTGTDQGKPITEANTAARQGLAGTEWELGVQAKKVATNLWKDVVQPKLQSLTHRVNIHDFIGDVRNEISKIPELSRRNSLTEALQSMADEYKHVKEISLEKLQGYKEGWARSVPEATYKGKPIGSALKEVKNMLAQKARDTIYQYVGEDGKQAYIDYGNLQSIIDSGVKSVKDPAKASLTRSLWEGIMNKGVTPIATIAGKILYRTGEGIELLGNAGAKTVKEVVDLPAQSTTPSTRNVPITKPTKLKVNSETPGTNKVDIKLPEDFYPEKLPTIEMGNKTKPKKSNLPEIN